MRIQRNKKENSTSNWSSETIIFNVIDLISQSMLKLIFSEILSKRRAWDENAGKFKKKKKERKTVQPIGHQNLCISVQQLLLFHSLFISQGFIFYHRKSLSLSLSVYLQNRYCQQFLFVCLFLLSLDYSFPGPFTSDIRLFLGYFFCTCLLMGLGCKFLQDPVQNT